MGARAALVFKRGVMDLSSERNLLDPARDYPDEVERNAALREFASEGGAFRAAFDHAAIGMAIVDLNGRFLQVNPALLNIVGYDEAELLATDFQSITHPDDLESDVALARQLMAGEIEHYHMEKRYLHKAGHVVWIQLSTSIARDRAGRACFAISQIQDISERRSAAEEIARRLRQIDRLTQTVRSILQCVAQQQGNELYNSVVRIIMQTFGSPLGVFLRRIGADELVGLHVETEGTAEVRCRLSDAHPSWYEALLTGKVTTDPGESKLPCGKPVRNWLAAPVVHDGVPRAMFAVGNTPRKYDEDDRDLLNRVGTIIGPALHARIQRDKLTPREAEVMDLIVSGMSQKQIATTLGISVQTTAKHRARVLEKLNLASDVQLVHLALQMRTPWTEGTLMPARGRNATDADGHPDGMLAANADSDMLQEPDRPPE
jgi:PAS domain S-box-containing protein